MFLTGTDAHLGGLGVLIEYKNSEKRLKRFGGKAGYEGFLNKDVATIPEILSDNGYFTVLSGKVSLHCPLAFGYCQDPRQSTVIHNANCRAVASRPPGKPGAVEPRLPEGLLHASRLLQPLRLGARPGAISGRGEPGTRRDGPQSRHVSRHAAVQLEDISLTHPCGSLANRTRRKTPTASTPPRPTRAASSSTSRAGRRRRRKSPSSRSCPSRPPTGRCSAPRPSATSKSFLHSHSDLEAAWPVPKREFLLADPLPTTGTRACTMTGPTRCGGVD